MDMASAQFTKTDRAVYETIRKFPDLFVQDSLAAIAEETHLSAPSLTRFAKRVGYKGFSEFQYQFRSDLEERDENQTGSKSDAYEELLR
jgi:DNA-binding MurR/RpiR family transcriptional regulator